MNTIEYDPFSQGHFQVGVRTIRAFDGARGRLFPCEIWYPADTRYAQQLPGPEAEQDAAAHLERRSGSHFVLTTKRRELLRAVHFGQMVACSCPFVKRQLDYLTGVLGAHSVIVFSHGSGIHRRSATYLCTHLAGHGYVVAAMDHSEVVAQEPARREGETATERAAWIEAVIASRVPHVRFLLDHLLSGGAADIELDAVRIGLVGYSFGGWTVLATPEVEPRVRSVVAMGPGGSANPRPGILPVTLTFAWGRDVPTLYLAADQDTMIPLAGVIELFERTPASKRLFIPRRADHRHFLDDVEGEHEALRAMEFTGEAAWIPAAMRPIAELCSGDEAHLFVRGLTLAHFDAALREVEAAERFLTGDVEAELAARGVEVIARQPSILASLPESSGPSSRCPPQVLCGVACGVSHLPSRRCIGGGGRHDRCAGRTPRSCAPRSSAPTAPSPHGHGLQAHQGRERRRGSIEPGHIRPARQRRPRPARPHPHDRRRQRGRPGSKRSVGAAERQKGIGQANAA